MTETINKKFILKDKFAQIKCRACGGDLRPVNELFLKNGQAAYDNMTKEFQAQTGMAWKESPCWNCCICGLIYDENFVNTGNVVSWLAALKEYYGNN